MNRLDRLIFQSVAEHGESKRNKPLRQLFLPSNHALVQFFGMNGRSLFPFVLMGIQPLLPLLYISSSVIAATNSRLASTSTFMYFVIRAFNLFFLRKRAFLQIFAVHELCRPFTASSATSASSAL